VSQAIRAVLFDIGGPIDLEIEHERLIDRDIRSGLAAEGYLVGDDEFVRANDRCVASFAPNLYRAMIWELARQNITACERINHYLGEGARDRLAERGGIELRPGILDLLGHLKDEGFKLGMASNHADWMLEELDHAGVLRFFDQRGVSGTLGYKKPDVRIFLRACEELAIQPADCIMVGDRIDNDIWPAKTLGMRAILFRTGRHVRQQPRTWEELADAGVHDVAALESAIWRMVGRSQPSTDGSGAVG
jgi:putative hydrolase of the HAD superfamily